MLYLCSDEALFLGVVPPQIDDLEVGMKLAVVGKFFVFSKVFV